MKKTSAVIGTLALASSLVASAAMANTSSTSTVPAPAASAGPAASASATNTSVTQVSASAPKLLDKIVMSYFGAYAGPTVTAPTKNLTPNDGKLGVSTPDSFQNLDSTVALGYKLTDSVSVSGNYRFIITPRYNRADDGTVDPVISHDPWLALKKANLIKNGGFSLSGDLRGYLPVYSSEAMDTAIRSTQTSTYEVPNSRLTLGVVTIERFNFVKQQNDGLDLTNYYQFVVSPFGSYQMTPTLAATATSDVINYKGQRDINSQNGLANVALGVGWDVTPKINVNPSINFFPTELTSDKTYFGLILSAQII